MPTALGMGYAASVSPFAIRSLTAANRGGWSYVDPRAFYYNGATYFTWVNGQNGDLGVSKYVHATGVTTSTTIAATFQRETHATPSVIVREPDHNVVVAYSAHDGASVYRWISTNPEDISAGSIANGGSSDYTYMTLHQLAGVTGQPVYWFFRQIVGGQGFLTYVTSTDGLATWGAGGSGAGPISLYTASGHVPYWRIASDQDRYIHVFATNTEPNTSGSFLYHFYIDGNDGSLHKSDGTTITAGLPLSASDATLVHNASSGGYCLAAGAGVDVTGKPFVLIRVGLSSQTINSMRVARWTGSAWQVDEVYQTAILPGFVYAPSAAVHPTNPDLVYGAKMVSSKGEIIRFVSPDSGTTWNQTALTTGSSVNNVYPEVPLNAGAGLDVLWPFGTFTSDTDFAAGMKGYG